MPAKNISKEDIEFLKRTAKTKESKWSFDEIKKIYNLFNNSQNATEIINELSRADLLNLLKEVWVPIYDTWSTQQKIALVKKEVRFFGFFPYFSHVRAMEDQELIRECLKAFNNMYPPEERREEYSFHLRNTFRYIKFNQENLEIFIKSFPDQSPFIFEETPFNEIQNWRELIKQNPNLALQNRMLEAMDEVNYFSKGGLQEFKEKYDDLLKNKTFYNHFIEKANSEIQKKLNNKKLEADLESRKAFFNNNKMVDEVEKRYEKEIGEIEASLSFFAETFGPYKRYIMEQELAKQRKTGSGVTA